MTLFKRVLLILPALFFILTCTKDEAPEKFILSVTISPEEGGTVSPEGGVFAEGTSLTLTATPATGYVFKEWTGDLQSTQNPVSASMDADMNVTLVFVRSDTDGDGVTDDIDICPNTPEGEAVNEQGCPLNSPIYLDENGITIKAREWSQVGESGVIRGVVYTVVNETMLREMVKNGEDVTKVCTTKVTDMSELFTSSDFNDDISSWDVSNVTDMRAMFYGTASFFQPTMSFNQPIGVWDVSKVTNMADMFWGSSFNQPIGNWNVGNVTTMRGMFQNSVFNQALENWNVSNVTDMSNMFLNGSFNQDIGSWDVSNVINMSGMFSGSSMAFIINPFNQYIGTWDVGNVINMSGMFSLSNFNQPIGNWDVSGVWDMSNMFSGSPFNQPIENWDVANAITMNSMFMQSSFNQSIGNWDVSNVTDMFAMFWGTPFNHPIGDWDVGNVTDMDFMFYGSVNFNQPIGSWNVANVTNMRRMFAECAEFNQDLSGWNVDNVVWCEDFSLLTPSWVLPKPNFTNCNPD